VHVKGNFAIPTMFLRHIVSLQSTFDAQNDSLDYLRANKFTPKNIIPGLLRK